MTRARDFDYYRRLRLSTIAQAVVRHAASQAPLYSISNGGVPITPRVALKNPPPAQSQGFFSSRIFYLMKDRALKQKTPGTEGK